MALRFVAIEKEAAFQGRTERWSNVYCYETTADSPTAYQTLINAVVAAEQPVHGSTVSFKRARVFTTSGLNGVLDTGNMYFVAELTGAGSMTDAGTVSVYRECAVLLKWPLPRKVGLLGQLGRQRSLKKWIHTFAAGPLSAAAANGISQITGGLATPFNTYANSVQNPVAGSSLVSPDGTAPNGTPVVHPWLEHRQFPRGRKES